MGVKIRGGGHVPQPENQGDVLFSLKIMGFDSIIFVFCLCYLRRPMLLFQIHFCEVYERVFLTRQLIC